MQNNLSFIKRLARRRVLLYVLPFAVVGLIFVFVSSAARLSINYEAEKGNYSATVVKCPDNTTSGGAYLNFGSSCKSFTNPVYNNDCPDPAVLRDGSTYYAVCTSSTLPAFKIRQSSDLVKWTDTGKYILDSRAPWAADDFYWAPEIHKINNKYVAVFTAKNPLSNDLCIGIAKSSSILGPYTASDKPLVCGNQKTVLDATIFVDDNGKNYLYWKEDLLRGNPSGYLFVQQLNKDGTWFETGSKRVQLFKNDLPWEGNLVEGPWVVKKDGQYYLFYSANAYNTAGYAIGIARSSTALGPFTKKGDPILRSGSSWKGPGHGSSVSTLNGQDYFVYHAWRLQLPDGGVLRELLIDQISWSGGWPVIGNGVPSDSQPYPL